MKKLFIFMFCICIVNAYCKAQYVDITNDQFRSFLVAKYPGCFNASSQMDTTCTAITTEDSLEIHGYTGFPMLEFTGIQYFDSLIYFDCSNNAIENYAPLPGSLLYLKCTNGYGTAAIPRILPASMPQGLRHIEYSSCLATYSFAGMTWPTGLKYLDISNDGLTNLGILPATLDTLICTNQWSDFPTGSNIPQLTALPALPAGLRYLSCGSNALTALPALPAGLRYLNCAACYGILNAPNDPAVPTLGSLPALPASLEYLICNNNKLVSLPALPASLIYLNCAMNKYYYSWSPDMQTTYTTDYPGIAALPDLPSTLQYLNCATNNMDILPPLPAGLTDLNISNGYLMFGLYSGTNHIPDLGVLPATLAYLNCSGNPINCLPHLPASMAGQSPYNGQPYNVIVNGINCLPNFVPGMRLSPTTIPLCNPINNIHGCEENPIISGNVFYDNNSNGIQDPGELPKANIRAQLDNAVYAFTNANGYYEFTSDLGSHTVTIDQAPVYYDIVPVTFSHTISTPDTVITDLIALQPNTSIDSMKITIGNTGTTRPGFNVIYGINYENVGTTIVDPNIIFTYDNSKLHFLNSSNASVIDNGSTLSLSLTNFQPGHTGSFAADFELTPSTVVGDIIWARATITGGTDICVDSTYSIVVASLDPNDKQATPSLTEEQVQAGNYIDYFIRFQNTGTADAINIVVSDTLSSMLQANTLEMLETSHSCKVTQDNDKVYFEFLNIHLPDMNTDEPASHGFIRFRIKPLTTLPGNTTITNKASIYFDFNAPVLTGDAITIVNLTTVPVKLSSFNVKKQNSVVQLYWNTEQEMNSKLFVVERSTDQRIWNEITRLNAAGNSSTLKNYSATDIHPAKGVNYYRLKQIDLDGKFNYSETRSVYFGNAMVVIAPNPVKDKMMIYLPAGTKPVSISLFNANGQLVKQFSSNEISVQVNVTGLSKGIYTISIKGENMNEVQKLLIH